jgi:hypothetical protein
VPWSGGGTVLGHRTKVRIGITHLGGIDPDFDGCILAEGGVSFLAVITVAFSDDDSTYRLGRIAVFDTLDPDFTRDTGTTRIADWQAQPAFMLRKEQPSSPSVALSRLPSPLFLVTANPSSALEPGGPIAERVRALADGDRRLQPCEGTHRMHSWDLHFWHS